MHNQPWVAKSARIICIAYTNKQEAHSTPCFLALMFPSLPPIFSSLSLSQVPLSFPSFPFSCPHSLQFLSPSSQKGKLKYWIGERVRMIAFTAVQSFTFKVTGSLPFYSGKTKQMKENKLMAQTVHVASLHLIIIKQLLLLINTT